MSDVAYAEFNDYAQRENADLADQNTIEAQLLAMSRYIDRKLRCAPGLFAPANGQTFYFDGSGSHLLPLRDDEGAYYPLRSVDADAIRPDYDRTGDYDQALSWDLDDVFIWPIPRNHEGIGRPIKSLELRRIGRAPYTIWPYADGSVRITGDWGWATTPPAIVELVVKLTRDVVDSQRGGGTASIAPLEEGVPLMDDTWRLWRSIENEYRYGAKGVY